MTPSIPTLEPGLQIGDYALRSQLESGADRQVWLGEQVSVKREVEIVCYYGADTEGFLADIRVKAKMEDGVLGLVYEAITTEEFIACAREVLPSKSLKSIADTKASLLPIVITRILSQVATTLKTLEKRGIAHNDFTGKDIRIGPNNVVRMHNIAKDGPRGDDTHSRQDLSSVLRELLKIGQPGATRMGTLIDYIEGTETQAAISWSQTEKLARQVDQQLSASDVPPPRSAPVLESKKGFKGTMIAGLIFGLIAVVIGFFVFKEDKPKFEPGLVITIPEGRYPRPNGGVVELSSFRIDATEVTIGEYSEFMIAWQTLDAGIRQELKAKGTPDNKVSIRPQHWNDYFPLARAQGVWNGRSVSLNHPVIGVDWWDAQAYANWKNGRLPTEQEWWAASSSVNAAGEKNNDWDAVGIEGEKIFRLAGNVSEWSGRFSKNPAFPIDSAKPVALGGSFKTPSKGALTREWLDSPSVRRDDLGFRVVYPVEQ